MVQIFDNFLDEDLRLYIQYVMKRLKYIPQRSRFEHENSTLKCSSPMKHPGHNLVDFLYKFKISKLFEFETIVYDIYFNQSKFGIEGQGSWHYDGTEYTVLYYPQEWNKSWEGGTVFKNPHTDEKLTVEYKENRLIIFEQHLLHRSLPHFNESDHRYTLAFKVSNKI
jgi:hypothetical protein